MRKFTSFMLMLLCAVTTWAGVDSDLASKKITSIGAAATSIEADQWYVLYVQKRGCYVSEETTEYRMRVTSNLVAPVSAEKKAGYLFQFEATGNANEYYIKSGNGLYFTINQGSSTVSAEPVAYTIAQIGDNAGHFYGQMVSDGRVLDANGAGGTLAGWGTTIPTGTGGNNDYQFLPVTLEAATYIDVTYNFTYGGVTKFTQVTSVEEGANFPEFNIALPYSVSIDAAKPEGTVNADNATKEIAISFDNSLIPFQSSTINGTFGDDVKWYHLTMRSKDVSYDAATGYALAQNVAEKNTSNLFAFTGNPIDGFNIYNYAAGAGKVFWRADATNGGRVSFTNIDETNGNTWILSKNGDAGYVFRLNGYTNGYMNDHQPQIAIWNSGSGATDGGSTITFTYVENPDLVAFYDVTYNYVYNGDTKFTKTITVEDGANYPAHAFVAPYGVAIEGEIPAETVTGNATKEFALTITKALPFEEGKYYYVRMHTNQPGFIGDIADDNTINVAWGKVGTSADTKDNYLWEFVGNVFDGIKVVNKGTGLEMTTTGGGNVTLTENGTSLFITETTDPGTENATDGFCLRNPNSANYINANYGDAKLSHWSATDAGSTFMLIEPTESLDVEITAAGYATYYWDLPAYIPEGVQAFVVNELNGTYAIMNEITGTIPANTGVILKGSAAEYSFAVAHYVTAETTTAVSGNKLRGSVASTYITPANTTCYVLANGENGVGLYQAELTDFVDTTGTGQTVGVANSFLNNANKAYLVVDGASAAVSYSFNFDWNGTTGIEGVVAEGAQDGAIYDITGRRVKAITAPGIYIVNGRKVVK